MLQAMISALSAALLALAIICFLTQRKAAAPVRLAFGLVLLSAMTALLLARGVSPLPRLEDLPAGAEGFWLRAVAVVWWLLGARFLAVLTAWLLGLDARSREARLFTDLMAAAIYLAAALIVLNTVLDLPINGLLATSGIIAIVIGLALQNTLADVFSGIAVGLEQPFRIGDRISLGDDLEGIVVERNWRSIRIRTDGETLATIPNSVVAKARIINRSAATQGCCASIEVVTGPAAPETVIELLQHAVMLCPQIFESPAPIVTLRRLGFRTSTYAVSFMVPKTTAFAATKSLLLRQVQRQLHHAGLDNGEPARSANGAPLGRTPSAALLSELTVFEPLSAEQVDRLASQLVYRSLAAGETLFEQGSTGASLYVVAAGVFEISRRSDSQPAEVLGRIGAGEYIGEISLLTGAPRRVTVTALTPAKVGELSKHALQPLIAEAPELCPALERSVRRGLALLDRDTAARVSHPVDTGSALVERIRSFFRHH
jgi:small-conductance mechanosensitive channel/CRP-like cAMP-binding protein